jgi:hypothetical protein
MAPAQVMPGSHCGSMQRLTSEALATHSAGLAQRCCDLQPEPSASQNCRTEPWQRGAPLTQPLDPGRLPAASGPASPLFPAGTTSMTEHELDATSSNRQMRMDCKSGL